MNSFNNIVNKLHSFSNRYLFLLHDLLLLSVENPTNRASTAGIFLEMAIHINYINLTTAIKNKLT